MPTYFIRKHRSHVSASRFNRTIAQWNLKDKWIRRLKKLERELRRKQQLQISRSDEGT